MICFYFFFFFSSRRRHTRSDRDWSSDVCSSDLRLGVQPPPARAHRRLIPRGEEDRVGLTAGRTAARRHLERCEVDLEPYAPGRFRITAEPGADQRAAPAQRARDRDEDAERRPDRAREELAGVGAAERERGGGPCLERLDRAPRDL